MLDLVGCGRRKKEALKSGLLVCVTRWETQGIKGAREGAVERICCGSVQLSWFRSYDCRLGIWIYYFELLTLHCNNLFAACAMRTKKVKISNISVPHNC